MTVLLFGGSEEQTAHRGEHTGHRGGAKQRGRRARRRQAVFDMKKVYREKGGETITKSAGGRRGESEDLHQYFVFAGEDGFRLIGFATAVIERMERERRRKKSEMKRKQSAGEGCVFSLP